MPVSSPTYTGATKTRTGVKAIPYAGETRIVVLTAPGTPEIRVGTTNPRLEFVDQVIRRLYGMQEGGAKHQWRIVAEAKSAVDVPQLENPGVHDWLTEKVNG